LGKTFIVILSILSSVSAQVTLKIGSKFEIKSFKGLLFLGIAAALYFISFIGYYITLKEFAINKIGPIMAVSVMCLVVLSGILFFGEKLSLLHSIGIVCGLASVLLLSIK